MKNNGEKSNKGFMINDLPVDDRPQEKLTKLGISSLSNAELLALIIRTGTKSENSVVISQKILNLGINKNIDEDGIGFLGIAELEDLMEVDGVGIAKASMIIAAVELGRRLSSRKVFSGVKVVNPNIIASVVMDEMRDLDIEVFKIAILNTKKELEYIESISSGTLDMTVVHPREVFKVAIKKNAHTIILIHNHPSGDTTPSSEDIKLTRRLCEVGKLIGIDVIDHLIIGDGEFYSFLENNRI